MDEDRRRRYYDPSEDSKSFLCCSTCASCESSNRIRPRRRCRSEDLERACHYSYSSDVWPGRRLFLNENFSISKFPDNSSHCGMPHKYQNDKVVSNHKYSSDAFGSYKQNGSYINVQSRSNGRLSPYRYNFKHSSLRNGDIASDCYDSQYVYTDILIENEEPRLFTVDEYQEKYGEVIKDRPKSASLCQQKFSTRPIIISNPRRSISPNFLRLHRDKSPSDKTNCTDKYSNSDRRRRTRAHSESEKHGCATYNSCNLNYFCSNTKNTKDVTYESHNCNASKHDDRSVSHKDVGVGDWSIYDNVNITTHVSKRLVKSNSKAACIKIKQPSAKIKSRLLAIKAKKALMETYSTGSDLSDNEISDYEDAVSKVSIDRDSDMSVEPVDHQECLTSDSGPSVSSISDSSSLNGLSTALIAGVVVTPNEDFSSILRPSMFPHVPPYLRFVSHDSTPLRPPPPVYRHLRWKLTTITPVVVRKTLLNSGFKLVRSECTTQGESTDWIGTWGKHMKSVCFKGLKESQKVNHFPGTFQIGRKDRLWKNLQKLMSKYGSKEFGLMPKTYVLPHDLKALKYDWDRYAALNYKWIVKPPASARGTGIKVVARWTQIPKRRPVVVQHYIAQPYLINGSKFDMRLYVVVTSIHPLRIYLYPDGLARFASVKYSDENNSLQDRYMHLTNYSINRLSKTYTHNQDAEACQGHKWTLQALMNYLKKERNVDTSQLWNSMKDLVIKTILSGESSISCLTKANIGSRYNCYELFGIDVLLDENLKPWLLEVNISPSLHSASPLDLHVKGPLVSLLLNMAQFHVPTKVKMEKMEQLQKEKACGPILHDKRLYTMHLSKEEKAKHSHFTELENRVDYLNDILTILTPDDVRHLIHSEDELTQKGHLERIFPTSNTHTYLDYLAGPRYYNRLFDAWEHKYSNNRKAGIKRLQELCEQRVHLEVPPIPAKSDDEENEGVSAPMQEEFVSLSETSIKNEVETSANNYECLMEGKHIVGDFCLICRPSVKLLMPSEGQPLPVQQHA